MELEKWFSTNKWNEKFIYIRQKHIEFFNIILFGITLPNKDYNVKWTHGSPCVIFDYIISGKGYIDYNGEAITVQAGDMYYLSRGADVRLYPDPDEPYKKIWMQITGSLIKKINSAYGMKNKVIVRKINAYHYFDEIKEILENSTLSTVNLDMRNISVKVFDMISLFMLNDTIGEPETDVSPANKIKNYLDSYMYKPVSLDNVSDYVHLTKSYVIRVFKKKYKITPIQYVLKIRLEQSKILLSDTSVPIKEIARQLQFSDSQHFSYAFKKYSGTTPDTYRKSKTATLHLQ